MNVCFLHRVNLILMPGDTYHAEAQHVLHGPFAGEGCVWHVLPGCRAVPQLLLAISHRLLPF